MQHRCLWLPQRAYFVHSILQLFWRRGLRQPVHEEREEFQESVGKEIVEEEGEGHEDDPEHSDDMDDEWA